jgi:hypothetical protein
MTESMPIRMWLMSHFSLCCGWKDNSYVFRDLSDEIDIPHTDEDLPTSRHFWMHEYPWWLATVRLRQRAANK